MIDGSNWARNCKLNLYQKARIFQELTLSWKICDWWLKLSLQLQAQFVPDSTYLPRKSQQCFLVQLLFRICGWSQNESVRILLHLYTTTKVTTDICRAYMPICLHNYHSNYTHLPLRWASEEEGATIPNVVKTIWIHHNSLAWFVLVCECLGWFHHSSSNMDHCGTNWAYKSVVKWMHFNIDDLSRPCFIVFRTKKDDAAVRRRGSNSSRRKTTLQ